MQRLVKLSFLLVFTMVLGQVRAQSTTQTQVDQMIEKKAEYHKLTNGEMEGYRIKIHFGVDKEVARTVRTKFSAKFNEYSTYEDYQQPNFVVLVGDFKTKLEAFEALKKIQIEFSNAFIVKGKIRAKI